MREVYPGYGLGTFQMYVLLAVKQLGEEAVGCNIADLISKTTQIRKNGQTSVAVGRLVSKGLLSRTEIEKTRKRQGPKLNVRYALTKEGEEVMLEARRVFCTLLGIEEPRPSAPDIPSVLKGLMEKTHEANFLRYDEKKRACVDEEGAIVADRFGQRY